MAAGVEDRVQGTHWSAAHPGIDPDLLTWHKLLDSCTSLPDLAFEIDLHAHDADLEALFG